MRRIVVATVLLLFASGVSAQALPQPRQFIDRSIVTFPESSDAYPLAETRYDPAQWSSAVTSKWAIDAAPHGLRFTLFVYPIGQATEASVFAQRGDSIEESLRDAVAQGTYADLVVGWVDLPAWA
jgi:hypothetical protein